MYILELHLKNFRNIEDETFRFRRKFTVVIGVNGRGKSTILQGLRIACGTFFLSIPEVASRHILESEIRLKEENTYLVPKTPVVVEAIGTFNDPDQTFTWRRRIPEGRIKTTSSFEDVGNLRQLGRSKYDQMRAGGPNGDHLNLPIVAFFGTSRVHGAGRNRSTRIGRMIFKEGYHDWFEMKASTYGYEDWLGSFDVLAADGREYAAGKDVFLATICKANPRYLKEVRWANNRLWLKVDVEGNTSQMMPLQFHSDGIRTYTEMVAELAYRCIILNGYLGEDAVRETAGVVMIDELDLHLHPSWQKHVVEDLQTAFPKIQFVATTHSPFIVQSLEAEEVIDLDGKIEYNPKDLQIGDVAKMMGVESPYSIENEENAALAERYLHAVRGIGGDTEIFRGPPSNDEAHLDEMEAKMADPTMRALLKLERLKYRG
jgi:predicted ATP-binding protein involved in virulence